MVPKQMGCHQQATERTASLNTMLYLRWSQQYRCKTANFKSCSTLCHHLY